MSDPIVIVSAARTPIGGLLGDFANLAAWSWAAWLSAPQWSAQACRPSALARC